MPRTYSEQLQDRANRFFSETGKDSASAKEIAAWMLAEKLWEPPREFILARLAADVADAMRVEHFTDPQGARFGPSCPRA